jgi:hypothetical protein
MTTNVLNDKYTNLFKMIPFVLEDMKHYNNEQSIKGNRYNYIKELFSNGMRKSIENIPDFIDFEGNNCYLKEFETERELCEWIISGMSKREQDEFFKSESDEQDSQ